MQELGFNELLRAYQVETTGLGVMGGDSVMQAVENGFGNYWKYLKRRHKSGVDSRLRRMLRANGGVLDAGQADPAVREVFYLAHLAVCCGLFDGWRLMRSEITQGVLDRRIEYELNPCGAYTPQQLASRFKLLHVSDAARTMHILRLLGLFRMNSSQVRQLSLACGPGDRDINGMHQYPAPVEFSCQASGEKFERGIQLSVVRDRPDNIILIDNDPHASQWFERLNHERGDWLKAYNADATAVLQALPEYLGSRGWGTRNLLAGLRIDHEMIPDAGGLLSAMSGCMDKAADLVLTIGAGHSLDEFVGRKRVLREIFNFLKGAGMSPTLVILHGSGSEEDQRESPYFGLSPLTTYEILHCKVFRKYIQDHAQLSGHAGENVS